MKNYSEIISSAAISLFLLCMPIHVSAENQGVVFWNKMQTLDGNKLTSDVGVDLNLTGTNWNFLPAMFDQNMPCP